MASGSDGAMWIYYGSQTGKAEAFAQNLGAEAKERGFRAEVRDLDNFCPSTFASHGGGAIVLLVANTGEGEPTDNAVNFHRWLMNPKTPTKALLGVPFAVFGLGDRMYIQFDRMGQQVDAGMERLGATRIYKRGTGDDGQDIIADFEAWKKEGLWQALGKILEGQDQEADPAEGAEEAELVLAASAAELPREVIETSSASTFADVVSRFYFEAVEAPIAEWRQLRQRPCPERGLSTVHVEIDAGTSALSQYAAAGTLELLPENSPADVARMLPLLGLREESLDQVLAFRPSPGARDARGRQKQPFPTPCTLRRALGLYCDLRSAPTRRLLEAMRPKLSPEASGRVGRLLASAHALRLLQQEHLGWTQWEFWSTLLGDGAETALDLGVFLRHCPRQRPRPYTIASSPRCSPGRLAVCASMLAEPSPGLEAAMRELVACGAFPATACAPSRTGLRFGLCSQWLCQRLRPGNRALARVRTSSFRLTDRDVPLIMIGAGAGLAPFRAFWNELSAVSSASAPRRASATLFFGCRHPDEDWIYRDEMQAVTASAPATSPALPLSAVVTAFSRQQEGRAYVQDKLLEKAGEVRDCLRRGGVVYACGSNQMGDGVLAALARILDGGSVEVQALRTEGRIVTELWGAAPPGPSRGLSSPALADEGPSAKRPRIAETSGEPERISAEETLELIKARRSIFPKDYSDAAVDDAHIESLLEAARWAPTHGRTEPWRFVVHAGDGRNRLIDATLDFYRSRDAAFWREAWKGEFQDFAAFQQHVERQRKDKWLRCSHLISICMRRQQLDPDKRLFPEHEEVAAVACAVQNMHLQATALRLGAYWSSWFDHFVASAAGVAFNGLCHEEGDRWLGIFCVGASDKLDAYRAARQPVEAVASWRASSGASGDVSAPPAPDAAGGGAGSPDIKRARLHEDAPRGRPHADAGAVQRLIQARRSIFPKDYSGAAVPDALVARLLDAARWAPTHGKTEPWRFVVFSGEGRQRLIDATLAHYERRPTAFWREAWKGEFADFAAFKAHVERQRVEKWLRCSHLVSICMRRQQEGEGKKLFPEHEEIAAVACAAQNMGLLATAMKVGSYWSSWFEHFTASADGLELHGLSADCGDRWLGVFCVGASDRLEAYRSARRPVQEFARWCRQ